MNGERAPRRRRAVRTGSAVALAFLMLVGNAAAWGLWSTSAPPLPANVSTAVVPVPQTVACTTRNVVPILGPQYAHITWTQVAGATSYVVSIENSDGTMREEIATVTTTTYDLHAGLLEGLVGGILNLLLSNQPAYITVTAVHSSGWRSDRSARMTVRAASPLGGLLGGMRCVN